MSITINNSPQSTSVTFALRATKQEVRPRAFFKSWPGAAAPFKEKHPNGVPGEVIHTEAFGSVFINIAHRFTGVECERLTQAGVIHEHCTTDMPDHRHLKPKTDNGALPAYCPPYDHDHDMVPDEHACCLIPEPFPVSMYFDVPVRYGMSLPLGDNFIANVRRAEGPLEHQYVTATNG